MTTMLLAPVHSQSLSNIDNVVIYTHVGVDFVIRFLLEVFF